MKNFKLPKTDMTSEELADELILRLNTLIVDSDVADLFYRMMNDRLRVPKRVAVHATIQAAEVQEPEGRTLYEVGLIGLLNGIVGTIDDPGSDSHGWGYIAAMYGDGKLLRFERTKTKNLNDREENAG